jgi:hypothetical protein
MKPLTDAIRRIVAPMAVKVDATAVKVDATAVKVDATAVKVAELAVDQKQAAAEHKQLSAHVQSALVLSSHAFAKATTALSSTSMAAAGSAPCYPPTSLSPALAHPPARTHVRFYTASLWDV